jgi:hypothetical protein
MCAAIIGLVAKEKAQERAVSDSISRTTPAVAPGRDSFEAGRQGSRMTASG